MSEVNPEPEALFLRKDDGTVFGPATLETLRNWAADGRVAPTDHVSRDRVRWVLAPEVPALGMEWILEAPDAEPYGPVNVRALLDLGADGTLPGSVRVRHARDGRRMTLWSLSLSEGVTLPKEESSESEAAPSGLPSSWSGIARERDQFERDATRWKDRYESEVPVLEATIHRLQEQLHTQTSDMEAMRIELDRYRIEQEQARRRWDPGSGNVNDFEAAFIELSQCYETLTRQLADKTTQLSELRESLTYAQDANAAKLAELEKDVDKARSEAREARRHQAQSEDAYQQILQSLRDLNFRFIRLREAAPQATAGAAAPVERQRPTVSSGDLSKGGAPRLRLTR